MNPNDLHQLFVEAVAEHQAGRFAGAQAIYERILKARPGHPDALHLLGVTFNQQGDQVRAITLIERAIAIRGGVADYHGNLALAFNAANRFPEAVASGRRALELNPRFADAANTVGMALIRLGQPDAAAEAFKQALEINPEHIDALGNLATAYRDQGLVEEMLAGYREVLHRQPNRAAIHSNLIYVMHLHPDIDGRAIRRELDEWNRRHGGGGVRPSTAMPPRRAAEAPDTAAKEAPGKGSRPLRVGFVSPDFRSHVVGNNLVAVFQQIDRREIETVGYYSGGEQDAITAALRAAMAEWRDIRFLSDRDAADLILADRIDILVDLSLHSGDNRLTLFALKPAPVQISYLGYCSSTGLSAIDFRLSDRFIDPPEDDLSGTESSPYSEKTLYLSNYLCYRPLGPLPEVGPLPALSNGYITFGCLNNASKVSAPALDLWLEILRRIPESRLLLHALPGHFRGFCERAFAKAGLARSRLEFVGRQQWASYIETFHRIDIALDPFPYGGGISTCDTLSMGVPVVTLLGRTAVGRMTGSLLHHAGFSSWIAKTPEQYAQIATGLSENLAALSDIRRHLRSRVEASPVMDARQMAASLTAAFHQAWQESHQC